MYMIEKLQQTKHARIVELRNLFLRTNTREALVERCKQWKVSMTTTNNYIKQVCEDLEKVELEKRRSVIRYKMTKSNKIILLNSESVIK